MKSFSCRVLMKFEVAFKLPNGEVIFKSVTETYVSTHMDGIDTAFRRARRRFEKTGYAGPIGRCIVTVIS